jgi:hypothetical protein
MLLKPNVDNKKNSLLRYFVLNCIMKNGTNIRVSEDVHKELVEHLKNTEKKIGKWTDIAIQDKIKKESKNHKR